MVKSGNIGQKLKEFRTCKGVSQLQLEVLADIPNGTVCRIEKGVINPTKETLFKIAIALQLSPLEQAFLFGIDLSQYVLQKYSLF